MWIENVAWIDVKNGNHRFEEDNTILISITDPGTEPPDAKMNFAETFYFQFLDIDKEVKNAFSADDATSIISILKGALRENFNVIVHCHAGVCRSGAVAEIGQIMGFDPCENFRIPNVRVKTMLLRELGLTYE